MICDIIGSKYIYRIFLLLSKMHEKKSVFTLCFVF